MFYHDGGKLQYPVRVEKPNPIFANALQQAIGGVQGEIRVCLQYLFQAWGARGPVKYRDMLLETGTEEMAHIEMLATAVALNLKGAPLEQEKAAQDPVMEAVLGGMNIQHVITTCDGRSDFNLLHMQPLGGKPDLGPASPRGAVQKNQQRQTQV